MRVFLRDVHHYLFDATFSPRPGETFKVRRDVRARMVAALVAAAERPRPHVVVGHSLGSVIAYDVLTDATAIPPVDALITVGSPLGLDEVQSGLTPPWSRRDGWPRRLADGPWANIGDPLDPVCGFDREIAGDFERGGEARVRDVGVINHGSWRHSIGKYLGQPALRMCLLDALR
jgi:pimeloyl-ACP methyl ester carboxylesterase